MVEGINIELPAATAIPLGFIASELITNAAKYGRITVRLEAISAKGGALSVANDGPDLPEGFDPAVGKGLGMRIVRSLVKQIGGELQIDRGGLLRSIGHLLVERESRRSVIPRNGSTKLCALRRSAPRTGLPAQFPITESFAKLSRLLLRKSRIMSMQSGFLIQFPAHPTGNSKAITGKGNSQNREFRPPLPTALSVFTLGFQLVD